MKRSLFFWPQGYLIFFKVTAKQGKTSCSVLNVFTSICVNLCLFAEKIIKEMETPARVSNYSIQQTHDNGMRLVMHCHTPHERDTHAGFNFDHSRQTG